MKFAFVTAGQQADFRRRLLAWFRKRQRALPFRGERDAYRIWVSEVMLQQTRVAAVLPYYERFLNRFPTVPALARAREHEVLKLWAGLGYYSRARNLHRAAKIIVDRHGGKFPDSLDAALALPGVGRYTAAAVLSIAYRRPLAVLDGNVARVLARLAALRGDAREPKHWRALEIAAQKLMHGHGAGKMPAVRNPGEWNQAMMELGALVCTPRAPRCAECPVAKFCRARRLGVQEEIPMKRKKRATCRMRVAAAVFLDAQSRTLLMRPPARNGNLFSGMWQFPAVETCRNACGELLAYLRRAGLACEEKNLTQRTPRTQRALGSTRIQALPAARHAVTYRDITLLPYLLRVETLPRVAGVRAVPLRAIASLPISSATRKIARAAQAE